MKITIHDTNITLLTDDGASSCVLLTKPDIADYGNVTARPLVKSYHLIKETIWERFGQCLHNLEECCPEDSRLGCYLMTFSALYAPLLSSSQAQNVLYYGADSKSSFTALLQDFMTFLQADSSLVTLPPNPFLFSGLANSSWHAAVIDLEACHGLQTICDAMTKVRRGGTVVLYTILDEPSADVSELLSYGAKTAFATCTLYTFTMDQALYDLIYPYSAEALVLAHTEGLFTQMEILSALTQNILEGTSSPEDCLYAIDLLRQAEKMLFACYDYLENPELPIHANTLKETVMDYYGELTDRADNRDSQMYLENLHLAAQNFYTAFDTEFRGLE